MWLPVTFSAHNLLEKESTLKWKNLLPLGANSFLLEYDIYIFLYECEFEIKGVKERAL